MKRQETFSPPEEEEREKEIKVGIVRKSAPSLYHSNYRAIYPDNYPAKFDAQFAQMLVELYSSPGDLVLDPMAGSGEILFAALRLDRHAIANDINPVASRVIAEKYKLLKDELTSVPSLKILTGDARFLKIGDNSVDLILTSGPFGLTISGAYDGYSNIVEDLANSKDYEHFRLNQNKVIRECFRVLKPGHLFGIETRPRSAEGHSKPLLYWILHDSIEAGFEFAFDYIEEVHPYKMWSFGKKKYLKPMPTHSYMLFFEKPEDRKLTDFSDGRE